MNEPNTIPSYHDLREEEKINEAIKADQEKARLQKFEQENQRRAEEALRDHRIATAKHLAMHSFFWLAGCATLIILAHIGDVAGYLMHIGTTAWSIALGIQIGKTS